MATTNTSLRSLGFGLAFLAILVVPMGYAQAATSAPGTLSVSGSVSKVCTVDNASLALPAYDPIVANLTAATTMVSVATLVKCTKGTTNVTLSLDAGSNSTATGCAAAPSPARCLTDGASHYLNYELYTSSAGTTAWPNGATGAPSVTASGKAGTSVSIYGQIPGGQDAFAGASYTDTVTETVNY